MHTKPTDAPQKDVSDGIGGYCNVCRADNPRRRIDSPPHYGHTAYWRDGKGYIWPCRCARCHADPPGKPVTV